MLITSDEIPVSFFYRISRLIIVIFTNIIFGTKLKYRGSKDTGGFQRSPVVPFVAELVFIYLCIYDFDLYPNLYKNEKMCQGWKMTKFSKTIGFVPVFKKERKMVTFFIALLVFFIKFCSWRCDLDQGVLL